MSSSHPDPLTTKQVASLLSVSGTIVRRWCNDGLLKCWMIPGSKHRRIPRASLVEFAKQHGMPLENLQ